MCFGSAVVAAGFAVIVVTTNASAAASVIIGIADTAAITIAVVIYVTNSPAKIPICDFNIYSIYGLTFVKSIT